MRIIIETSDEQSSVSLPQGTPSAESGTADTTSDRYGPPADLAARAAVAGARSGGPAPTAPALGEGPPFQSSGPGAPGDPPVGSPEAGGEQATPAGAAKAVSRAESDGNGSAPDKGGQPT